MRIAALLVWAGTLVSLFLVEVAFLFAAIVGPF